LISNAIKFSPENGSIEIESQYSFTDSGLVNVVLNVIDYGIGISEED
jgi:signal transduction histidine kinase